MEKRGRKAVKKPIVFKMLDEGHSVKEIMEKMKSPWSSTIYQLKKEWEQANKIKELELQINK